jgi:hypothetical protein
LTGPAPPTILRPLLNLIALLIQEFPEFTRTFIDGGLLHLFPPIFLESDPLVHCDLCVLGIHVLANCSDCADPILSVFFGQACAWTTCGAIPQLRKLAMQFLFCVVRDGVELPLQTVVDLGELALSQISSEDMGVSRFACLCLGQVLRAEEIIGNWIEIFGRTMSVLGGKTAEAALRLQIRALKRMAEVPAELNECLDWGKMKELLEGGDPEMMGLVTQVVSLLMDGGELFIEGAFVSGMMDSLRALMEQGEPYRATVFAMKTVEKILSGGTVEHQRAILFGGLVEVYVRVLDSLEPAIVVRGAEALVHGVKCVMRVEGRMAVKHRFENGGLVEVLELMETNETTIVGDLVDELLELLKGA